MRLVHSSDGKCRLHIWRTGTSFESTRRYPLFREWNNIKFAALPQPRVAACVRHHTLRKPLPFDEAAFDVVYCNHVAEHLSLDEGRRLMCELHRVLKPGGICRLVVPDMEAEAREYLRTLEQVLRQPSEAAVRRYEWAVADLIDQAVRRECGGVMGQKLRSGDVDWPQIRRTNGDVFDNFAPDEQGRVPVPPPRWTRLRRRLPKTWRETVPFLRNAWYRVLQELLIRTSGKPRVEWFNENNRWLYDRFSLQELLKHGGFMDVTLVDYKTSHIEDWSRYDFDRSEKGDYALEPSVYAEAWKSPQSAAARAA